jgi:LysM repeat protein
VTGRSSARLLAPLALVVSAVALFAVVTSGGGESGTGASSTAAPTATETPAAKRKQQRKPSRPKTYTVKPGDTPSSIAQANGVDVDALLQANPDANPSALTVGQKLDLP